MYVLRYSWQNTGSHYSAVPLWRFPSGLNVAYWPTSGKPVQSSHDWPFFLLTWNVSFLTPLFLWQTVNTVQSCLLISLFQMFSVDLMIIVLVRTWAWVSKLNLKMHIPKQKQAVLAHEAGFLPQQLFLITFLFQQAALNRNDLGAFINMWCIYRVYCSISAQTFAMSFWKHILIVRICSEI